MPFGIEPTFQPPSDNFSTETIKLFRFYVRVLWATGVLLDDLEKLLRHTDKSRWRLREKRRRFLTEGPPRTPLDVDVLQDFINHVGKHTARKADGKDPASGLHCLNHHVDLFFEDTDDDMTFLEGLGLITAKEKRTDDRPLDAVLLPKLGDTVDTVAIAMRNIDTEINNPVALSKLTLGYGACG